MTTPAAPQFRVGSDAAEEIAQESNKGIPFPRVHHFQLKTGDNCVIRFIHERDGANGWITAMEGALTLTERELASAKDRIKELEKTLQWYANKDHWDDEGCAGHATCEGGHDEEGACNCDSFEPDFGDRARKVLDTKKGSYHKLFAECGVEK
jgi:hypothetical protein